MYGRPPSELSVGPDLVWIWLILDWISSWNWIGVWTGVMLELDWDGMGLQWSRYGWIWTGVWNGMAWTELEWNGLSRLRDSGLDCCTKTTVELVADLI